MSAVVAKDVYARFFLRYYEFLQSNPCILITSYKLTRLAALREPVNIITAVMPETIEHLLRFLNFNFSIKELYMQSITDTDDTEVLNFGWLSSQLYIIANKIYNGEPLTPSQQVLAEYAQKLVELGQQILKNYCVQIAAEKTNEIYDECINKLQQNNILQDDE